MSTSARCIAIFAMGLATMAAIAFAGRAGTAAAGESPDEGMRLPGDPARGEVAFQKCYACHSVSPDESGLPGPNLHRIIGRAAAAQPGFDYSPAMLDAAREQPWTWTPENLDAFIADPEQWLPGTSMGFVGLRDAAERADVIAYLANPSGK